MTEQSAVCKERYWEIDAFRGIAIVMMVTFHVLFDLSYLGMPIVEVHSGFWRLFAIATASTFVFLVGVSLSISHARSSAHLHGRALTMKYIRRGMGILLLGLVITLVTALMIGEGMIIFGILHLIGVSIMIAPLFLRLGCANFMLGVGVILIGIGLTAFEGPIWLAWMGLHPSWFYSLDYEPLFPWFGIVLIGIAVGSALYPGGRRLVAIPEVQAVPVRALSAAGRHSLFIYLLHQPVIIGLILLGTGLL
ncbi:MAG TPA: DUF1624 domain-containing protein [Methanoculleus sp.]|nr:DUF1624 domain-containing protein [Methanoculleus sp.]